MITRTKRKLVKKTSSNKVITRFKIQTRSRHPSCSWLRKNLGLLPFRSLYRHGSTTLITDGKQRVELNSIESIKISGNKKLMKEKFTQGRVKTADWFTLVQKPSGLVIRTEGETKEYSDSTNLSILPYPIVAKSLHGSRGDGNTLLKTSQELQNWIGGKTLSNYIFEKFYNYTKEYRLHVSKNGCFYTCRKMIKEETPKDDRWRRHDDNCVWVLEENPSFDKPSNWVAMVADCVKALRAVGLEIGAIDLKCQSTKDSKGRTRENPEWIVLETNSAPSMGEITQQKYLVEIPKLLKEKYESSKRS